MRLILAGIPDSILTNWRASASLSLTPFNMTYSKVMRLALDKPGQLRHAASKSSIGYFLFSGTSSLRSSSETACNDMASITPVFSPIGTISGTTPEVDNVIRRLDRLRPSPSLITFSASATASPLYSGSPMPIITTLVTLRRPLLDCSLSPQSSRSSRAATIWPTISAQVRFLTSFCVPVWQNRQVRVQPTWLEMHKVPRSISGM